MGNNKIIILLLLLLLIFSIILITKYFKIYGRTPEVIIDNIIMDDNDLIFSVEYTDNRLNKISNNDKYNIKISNLKIEYNDFSEIIYKINDISCDNEDINNTISMNLDNDKLKFNFHIKKNQLKKVEKLNLFIGKIEIYTDKNKIAFYKKQNISINIPEDSYNRKIKIYKAKYANDGSIDLKRFLFIVNEKYSSAYINFINSPIKETINSYNESTSIEDNLAIKNNSYIQDEKFNKYYQINGNDSNNGYHIGKEGYLLKCWRTFELPLSKATNKLSIYLQSQNKNIIIALED